MTIPAADVTLRTERLGPLPLVNHVLRRLGLEALLGEFVPAADPRQYVSHAKALGVLVRSILVEREERDRQSEEKAGQQATHGHLRLGIGRGADHPTDQRVGQVSKERFSMSAKTW